MENMPAAAPTIDTRYFIKPIFLFQIRDFWDNLHSWIFIKQWWFLLHTCFATPETLNHLKCDTAGSGFWVRSKKRWRGFDANCNQDYLECIIVWRGRIYLHNQTPVLCTLVGPIPFPPLSFSEFICFKYTLQVLFLPSLQRARMPQHPSLDTYPHPGAHEATHLQPRFFIEQESNYLTQFQVPYPLWPSTLTSLH